MKKYEYKNLIKSVGVILIGDLFEALKIAQQDEVVREYCWSMVDEITAHYGEQLDNVTSIDMEVAIEVYNLVAKCCKSCKIDERVAGLYCDQLLASLASFIVSFNMQASCQTEASDNIIRSDATKLIKELRAPLKELANEVA